MHESRMGPFYPDFQPEQLNNTPSIRHGMTREEENSKRKEGVNFIINCGHQLRLPYNAICTAAVYFHKFYVRRSFKVHMHYDIAAACLYLAAKAEETRKRCAAVVETCYYVKYEKKAPNPRTHQAEHSALVERVLDKELILLQTIEFNFQVSLPQIFLPVIFDWFKEHYSKLSEAKVRKCFQIAWFYLGDFFKLPAVLFHPPQYLALICVELGIRHEALASSSDSSSFNPSVFWYKTFAKELSVEDFEKLLHELLTVVDFQDLKMKEDLKRRRKGSSK